VEFCSRLNQDDFVGAEILTEPKVVAGQAVNTALLETEE